VVTKWLVFGALFFGDFLLCQQKKVTRQPGRNPAGCSERQTPPARAESRRAAPQVLPWLTSALDVAKATSDEVVRQALDALEAGAEEALADDTATSVKRGLPAEPGVYLA